MSAAPSVKTRHIIGREQVREAQTKGLRVMEVLPGDIVTDLAAETAESLGVRLLQGPIEKPGYVRCDGATSMRRVLYRRSPRWVAPGMRTAPRARRIEKLVVIGAGGVGSALGHLAVHGDGAETIALIDVMPGLAASVALDLNHARGITRRCARVSGGGDLKAVAGAEVIVVAAGRPRTPGMSRADLYHVNRRVILSIGEAVRDHAPNAVIIVMTNPLDEMTALMLRVTGFARERVLGMAGALDSGRFRYALARAAGVETGDVEAMTLGSHGEEMVPVVSSARIKGRALDFFLTPEQIEACVRDAVTGGGQVVALRRTGSAAIAPAHAAIEMLDHIRAAATGLVPVSVRLDGEFGLRDVVLGVPCRLGAGGLLAVEEITLSEAERGALHVAAASLHARGNQAQGMMGVGENSGKS